MPKNYDFSTGFYRCPSPSLLTMPERDEWEVEETSKIIEETLKQLGMEVEVSGAEEGPVVTMYKIRLGSGVRVEAVLGTARELKTALGGKNIRFVDSIPGEPCIGIEVPNDKRGEIGLESIIGNPAFFDSFNSLPISLGVMADGYPDMGFLDDMPHLLVAGTSGSGKTSFLNSCIVTMIYTLGPDEVRLVLVNTKGGEFDVYNGLPHLLFPVISDRGKAVRALQWAVDEIEKRSKILAEYKAKNIRDCNLKAIDINDELPKEKRPARMPYIAIVIDEVADLMAEKRAEVENAISRISLKGKSVGVHMIIATREIKHDIFTGAIKYNIPTRIAFKTASARESDLILDTEGAECLLRNGDMLFISPELCDDPIRVHGAFINRQRIKLIVDSIKKENGTYTPDEDVLEEEPLLEDEDPLYDEILDFIVEKGECSVSMLQKKFDIGYGRAARMIRYLEDEGYIVPDEDVRMVVRRDFNV